MADEYPPNSATLHAEHVDSDAIITRGLRLGYVVTNGLASIGELATGVVSGNVALAIDGLHGTAEIGVGNSQMKDAAEHEVVSKSRRRGIYSALSGLSLLGAGVAVGDVAGVWDVGLHSLPIDSIGLASAAVSATSAVVAGSIIVHRVRERYATVFRGRHLNPEITPTEKDVTKHIVLLDMPTSLLAFSSGAIRVASYYTNAKHGNNATFADTENAIGLVSGIWGAYLFRPTRYNLEHGMSSYNADAHTH